MIQTTEFIAVIAPGKNGLQFGDDEARVMLDAPSTETAAMMRLQLCRRRAIKVTVEWDDEDTTGAEIMKPKKEKKEKPGQWGEFWRHLWQAGFYACPGVAEAIDEQIGPDDTFKSPDERAKIGLRRVFGVESLTLVGPNDIHARFEHNTSALILVSNAERRTKE